MKKEMTKEEEEVGAEICALLSDTQQAFVIQMCPLLDMADGHAKDIESEIRQRKWYRHELKKLFNDTVAKLHKDCPKAKSGEKGMPFVDYLDNTTESLQKHVDCLYWALKNAMDKHNVEDSAFLAKLELTGALLTLAFHIYRKTIESIREQIYRHTDVYNNPQVSGYAVKVVRQRIVEFVDKHLGWFNPHDSLLAWCHMMKNLPSRLTLNREKITQEPSVQQGMKNIYYQMTSEQRLTADMDKALDMNNIV